MPTGTHMRRSMVGIAVLGAMLLTSAPAVAQDVVVSSGLRPHQPGAGLQDRRHHADA